MANGKPVLGISNQSLSSALGPLNQGPDLATLLGTSVKGNLGQARAIEGQIGDVAGQEQPGVLQRLASPGGLALALGILAAGKGGGADAAAALGLGGLQGIQAQIAKDKQEQANAIEMLQKQRDEALERADKAIQQTATTFQTNPEAFIDPVTGETTVPESELGFLVTGQDIKLYPQTRRLLEQRREAWDQQVAVVKGALEKSTNLEDSRRLTDAFMRLVDWKNPDPGVVDAVAKSMGTDKFPNEVVRTLLQYGKSSGLAAIKFAFENNRAFNDPDVWRRVTFNEDSSVSPSELEDLEYAMLREELSRFQAANPDVTRQARDKAGDDDGKFIEILSGAAFGGDTKKLTLFRTKSKAAFGNDDDIVRQMQAYRIIDQDFGFVDRMGAMKQLGLSDEQRALLKSELTNYLVGETERDVAKIEAERAGGRVNTASARFRKEAQLSPQASAELAARVFQEAQKAATLPSGHVDPVKLDAEFERIMGEQIELIKQKRGIAE